MYEHGEDVTVGVGMTVLIAGYPSQAAVYEAAETPVGICRSYYVCPGTFTRALV